MYTYKCPHINLHIHLCTYTAQNFSKQQKTKQFFYIYLIFVNKYDFILCYLIIVIRFLFTFH